MIKKIRIKNVASYKEKEALLQTNKKINLIYGLNGAGKTTISNFLFSPAAIEYKDCLIDKDADDKLYVYNQKFIAENFFASNQLPGIFTLSKENKDIADKINAEGEVLKNHRATLVCLEQAYSGLKNDFQDKEQKFEESIWNIKSTYFGGDRTLDFCMRGHVGSKKDLAAFMMTIGEQEKPNFEIEDLKKEANEILGDSTKLERLKLVITKFSEVEKNEIFKKQIVGNSNSTVAALINKLENSDWVREGMSYVGGQSSDFCPFCQSRTITNKLIKEMSEFFNASFEEDLNQLNNLLSAYQTEVAALAEEEKFTAHSKMQENKVEFQLAYRGLKELLGANLKLMEDKLRSPSTVVQLNSSEEVIKKINVLIENSNSEVDLHNRKIDQKDEVKIEIKSNFWKLMRFNYSRDIDNFLAEKKESKDKLSAVELEAKGVQTLIQKSSDHIVQLQKQTINIEEAVANINLHLIDMGITHFKLIKHNTSDHYILRREGADVNIYQSLSEGEKTVISFLYFVETCKGKKTPQEANTKKIIIIDDPISSLSHVYIFNIGRLIKKEFFESTKYEQVFILTHNLYFYYELARQKRKKSEDEDNQNLFRISKPDTGSEISSLKFSEIQNDYQAYWHFLKEKSTSEALLANCMRNILEHFFGFMEKRESLNTIFQHPKLQENKYQAFLRYMDRESHSNTPNISDHKDINHEHFREAFQFIFEKTEYMEHYNIMMGIKKG